MVMHELHVVPLTLQLVVSPLKSSPNTLQINAFLPTQTREDPKKESLDRRVGMRKAFLRLVAA